MKKYFIADWLTALKIVPAVLLILAAFRAWHPGVAFGLFASGELLDALDGMAANHWHHPASTDRLWFRKHIKLLESGLDMLVALGALTYLILRVSATLGFVLFYVSLVIGFIVEGVVYGRLFGTAENAKKDSLIKTNPARAQILVGIRFAFYLTAIALILVILLYVAFPLRVFIALLVACGLVSVVIIVKKNEEGRLKDIIAVFKRRKK